MTPVDKKMNIKKDVVLTKLFLLILEYLLAAFSLVFFIYYSFFRKEDSHINFFTKFKFLYLTNIFLILSVFTLFLGLSRKIYAKLTDLYLRFLAVAVCCEFLVVAGFWTCFFVSPSLLRNHKTSVKANFILAIGEFPKHLFPFIALLIEQYRVDIAFSVWSVFVTTLFFVFFGVANEFLINYNDICLYPIFKKFGAIQRVGLYCLMIVVVSFISLAYALIKDKDLRARSRNILAFNKAQY